MPKHRQFFTVMPKHRQFFDALALRYRWRMKRLPSNRAYGKQFTVDHAISCLKGGFIHRRYDELRDIVANLLDEVAYDVRVEPPLTPLTGEGLPSGSNIADDARLDIAARGFWERCEMTFFDIRVFNPYAKTHLNQSLNAAFTRNEREKKRQCNQRCIQVEHGSFTPLVFIWYGGCSRETHHFLSTLSEQLSDKKGILPGVVMNWLRTKICFAQMRAQILYVRGSRSVWHRPTLNATDIEQSNLDSDIN